MIIRGTDPVAHAQRRLAALYPGDADHAQAIRWARGVLADQALDPAATPWRALRALRRADRRLDPVTARFLTDSAAGRSLRPARRASSPVLEA